MSRFFSFLLCFCLVAGLGINTRAQSFPPEWNLSTDGTRLTIGGNDANGLYDSATIRSINLIFTQSNWYTLLQSNYQSKTDLAATLVMGNDTFYNVGVRFKGQTSYFQVSSQKKSFNISMDYLDPAQNLMGYQTLNLNNCFLDESFIREVFYENAIKQHIPAAKANFVHLFVNGQDWGLYANVQQLNKDFLKEWFQSNDGINWRADSPSGSGPGGPGGGPNWGDGTAALNYLGADSATYKQYYTLKSNDVTTNPWQKLIDVCDKLNNTSAATIKSILPLYLDVDRTLWFLASEIAFSDDDGYVYKGKMDYYCYYEPETGRIVPQEYDGNTTIDPAHVSWSPFYNETNANYPLLNVLLSVPEWRQRYLAHMRTIIEDELNPTTANAIIDNYKSQIDALVQSDPKKIYTYTQFQNEIPILKSFVQNRNTYLNSNSEVAQIAPVISSVSYFDGNQAAWTAPQDMETAWVNAQVASFNGIDHVSVYYSTGIAGSFTELQMADDGVHQDGASGDGVYGVELPAYPAGTWVRFYVEAVAANAAKTVSYMPKGAEHDVYIYNVSPKSAASASVVINEIMAFNTVTVTDEIGEYEDWIELYNPTANTVDLSGWYLSDNPANLAKWDFPSGTSIAPGAYLIIWADEDSIQGPMHANFKLSSTLGETVWLLDSTLAMVDSVQFGAMPADIGYARVPNGSGPFTSQAPTYNANNSPTQVAETVSTGSLLVFPNPARDVLYVRNLSPVAETVTIFDATGRKLHEGKLIDMLQIPTSSWANGMYFLRGKEQTLRFVVAH